MRSLSRRDQIQATWTTEPLIRRKTLTRLRRLPVEILTEIVVEQAQKGKATAWGPDGFRELRLFDSVVVAVRTEPNDELVEPLRAGRWRYTRSATQVSGVRSWVR